jgi:hypothetical protein
MWYLSLVARHMEILGIRNPSSIVNPYIHNETLLNGEWLYIRHEKRHKRIYIKRGHRHWYHTRPQYNTHQKPGYLNQGVTSDSL